MDNPSPSSGSTDSLLVRFWHVPVCAERLALTRILLGVALLADQLLQYLPRLEEFFGAGGVAPAGLHDLSQLESWRWTAFFFSVDDLSVIYPMFALWFGVTLAFTLGWKTRWMNVLTWFMTRCFVERNPMILTSGDDVLMVTLFLLIFAPCGRALSLDALKLRRRGLLQGPAWVAPWSVRLLQLQLCLIYCTTGLAKLVPARYSDGTTADWFTGTWWDGTSIHYFLNDAVLWRFSYAQIPVPLWLTMPMTYVTVCWEVLFPLLVICRRTRPMALFVGIMFHLGILVSAEVGWFAFYTLALYGVWVPDSFWRRFDRANLPDRWI